MVLRARGAGACLLFVAILATAFSTAANSASATMRVSVTVVRSCSVSTPPATGASSVSVTLECRKGAADVVRFGAGDEPLSGLQRVLPGPNRISIDPPATPAIARPGAVIVTIDF